MQRADSESPAALHEVLKDTLAPLARFASELGDPADLNLQKTLDHKFAQRLTRTSERVLTLSKRIEQIAKGNAASVRGSQGGGAAELPNEHKRGKERWDEDAIVDNFSMEVRPAVDRFLEFSDTYLDVATGRRKAPPPRGTVAAPGPSSAVPKPVHSKWASAKSLPQSVLQDDSIPKPQDSWTIKPDHGEDAVPWQPTLDDKPHAMVPLDYVPTPGGSRAGTPFFGEEGATGTSTPSGKETPDFTKHPYYYETKHLPYPSSLFTSSPPVPPAPFATTPYTFVNTPDLYNIMIAKLQGTKEIAVDLEYHSRRSFTGFLCLMQISTRQEDFIVDLLALRDLVRQDKVGGVMVDPKIVKVFHGAESDILWLQQDFDIYVVGLFDTYHATKVLCESISLY